MDADWYEDPLDRYDGRFFDGENWTAKVSADGVLTVDEDFASLSPAVAPVSGSATRRPTLGSESPVRVVATLDESLVSNRTASTPSTTSRRPWLLGGLGLLALAALAIFLLTRSGTPDLDPTQVDRVEDLEAGPATGGVDLEGLDFDELEVDAPEGTSDPDDRFDPSEMISVGSLNVVNGSSVLATLVEWHEGYAADRGVVLGDDHGCWFGELGSAAVQVAHCGPVAGSADTEYLFDLVPVDFIDVDAEAGEVVQFAQPIVDAVSPDTVIANAVTLIGATDGPAPPEGLTQTRGERGGG